MMRWTSNETGDTIVDIVASLGKYIDDTYHEDGVTANYSGKKPTLKTLDDIMQAVEFVSKEVATLGGHPGEYLRPMVKSFGTLTQFLAGDSISYKDAVRDVQEVDLREIPRQNFVAMAERIDRVLTDWGYKGTVDEKIATWQNDKRIPADKVIETAKLFLEKSRVKSKKRICALPDSETIDSVNELHGVYFSGLSEYIGDFVGRLSFNVDRPWNTPTFASVLVHEGYPGHHTYYTHWDDMFRKGTLPLEASYVLLDSPINCLFEGVPEIAIRLLGWDDPDEETPEIGEKEKAEIIVAKNIMDLQRMLQTNANYFYNVGGQSKEDVIHYMTKDGWYSQIEANNTFRYFSGRYKSLYYPCYYYGRWIMQQAYDLFPKERRAEFYRMIYDTPHTNSTLIKAVKEATGKPFEPFASI